MFVRAVRHERVRLVKRTSKGAGSMRLSAPLVLRFGLALATGGALVAALPSMQAASAAATAALAPAESVTVLAPEVVRTRVGTSRHGRGVRIEVASLELKVDYSDLDLTKASDQKAFKDRIWSTAREVCKRLNAQTPSMYQPPTNTPCAGDAASEALKVADEVIAATNRA
jgi:UrcA family protein